MIKKWCAILCAYRTKEYGDFKRLANKIDYGLIFNILADKGFKAENINVSPKQYYKISYFHCGYCEVISLLFPQFHLV